MKRLPLVLLSLVSSLAATPLFATMQEGPAAEFRGAVPQVVDLDRDGFDDVIEGRYLLHNNGGILAPARELAGLPAGAQVERVADFNGDGLYDLQIINQPGGIPASAGGFSGGPVDEIYLGNADGSYTRSWGAPVAGHVRLASDLDNDGRADLIVVTSKQENGADATLVAVYRSLGDGTFARAHEVFIDRGSSVQSIVAADFNRDGYLDIAIRYLNTIDVLLGRGDGTLSAPDSRYLPWAMGMATLVAADVDGDGNADLSGSSDANGVVRVLLGDGRGAFPRTARAKTIASNGQSGALRVVTPIRYSSNARYDLTGASLTGDLLVLSFENNQLNVVSRTATGLHDPSAYGGAFNSRVRRDAYVVENLDRQAARLFYGVQSAVVAPSAVSRGGRTRAVAQPAVSQQLRMDVSATAACLGVMHQEWTFQREGLFARNVANSTAIDAVIEDGLLFLRIAGPAGWEQGVLAETEAGRFGGSMVRMTSCGPQAVWMDATLSVR
jgi:hypothetical protein